MSIDTNHAPLRRDSREGRHAGLPLRFQYPAHTGSALTLPSPGGRGRYFNRRLPRDPEEGRTRRSAPTISISGPRRGAPSPCPLPEGEDAISIDDSRGILRKGRHIGLPLRFQYPAPHGVMDPENWTPTKGRSNIAGRSQKWEVHIEPIPRNSKPGLFWN